MPALPVVGAIAGTALGGGATGAIIGGLAGAAASSFLGNDGGGGNVITGSPGQLMTQQVQNLTPEQQELLKKLVTTIQAEITSPKVDYELDKLKEEIEKTAKGLPEIFEKITKEKSVLFEPFYEKLEKVTTPETPVELEGLKKAIEDVYESAKQKALMEYDLAIKPKLEAELAGPTRYGLEPRVKSEALASLLAPLSVQRASSLADVEKIPVMRALDLEKARIEALANLIGKELTTRIGEQEALKAQLMNYPLLNLQLQNMATNLSKFARPEWQSAVQLLGFSPFTTIAGFQPAQPGLIQTLAGGLGQAAAPYLLKGLENVFGKGSSSSSLFPSFAGSSWGSYVGNFGWL